MECSLHVGKTDDIVRLINCACNLLSRGGILNDSTTRNHIIGPQSPTTCPKASTIVTMAGKLTADQVRARCVEIFETAFPKQKYVTAEDLKAFSQMLSPNAISWDCPLGAGNGIEKPTPDSLYQWFMTNFDPNSLKYTEYIFDSVFVSGNTASFKKGFFCDFGKSHVQADTFLIMEIDDDGKLVRWIDHYDAEEVAAKFAAAAKIVQG
eukprot:scaffold4223_cov189-Amphora_coffeaeformis.AAC.47